jgi:predicted transcriptional regulator
MTSVKDVEEAGVCIDADRVDCPRALKHLKKKGLICKVRAALKKPAPVKKKRGRPKKRFWDWLFS